MKCKILNGYYSSRPILTVIIQRWIRFATFTQYSPLVDRFDHIDLYFPSFFLVAQITNIPSFWVLHSMSSAFPRFSSWCLLVSNNISAPCDIKFLREFYDFCCQYVLQIEETSIYCIYFSIST